MTIARQYEPAPDCLKAFGIALVVFGHVLRGLFSADIVPEEGTWAAIDHMIYLFHMPLFFYASGLFMAGSVEKYGERNFMRKMARSLLLPLVIWSYIQYILQFVASASINGNYNFLYVITAPFPPRQQFWFLGVLFIIAIASARLFRFKKPDDAVWVSIAALFAINILLWPQIQALMVFHIVTFLFAQAIIHAPFFLMGVVLNTEAMRRFRLNSILCLLVFAGSLVTYQTVQVLPGLIHAITSVLCVLSAYKISLNLSDGADVKKSVLRIVTFVGMNSMIIYLAHVIGAAAFRVLLMKLEVLNPFIYLGVGFTAGFIGPLFLVPIGIALGQTQTETGAGGLSRAL